MAETIVMIHGMWGGPWVWENFKRFFEDRGYHYKVQRKSGAGPGLNA